MQAINSLTFKLSAVSLFSAVLLLPIMSFAHEDNSANALKKEVHVDKNLPLYEAINSSYLANVKPILEKSVLIVIAIRPNFLGTIKYRDLNR